MSRPSATRPRTTIVANAVPAVGGQGVNLQHLVTALAPVADLTVFAARAHGDPPMFSVPPSRLARWLARTPVVRRRRDWTTLLTDTRFDRAVARRLGPADLVHAVTGPALATLRRARALGAVTVLDSVTEHIGAFAEPGAAACRSLGSRFPIHPALQRRMEQEYDAAHRIRVMSERARRTFVARGVDSDRVRVVSPALWSEEFPETARPTDRFRIGYVGALEPWKGFHLVLDAFRHAAQPDWELAFFGGAGSRAATALISAAIRRDARVDATVPDMRAPGGFARVYGHLSVLVHPSFSDGFGLVVGEAMACGVPVIVTDATGAADLVADGVNGFVIPTGDTGALVKRLRWCGDHRDRLPAMGREARAAAAALTPARFRREFADLVGDLIPDWPAGEPRVP